MTDIQEFFAMGGYAFYVWTSYSLTAIALIGVVVWSTRQLKQTRTQAFHRARQTRERS